MGSGIWRLRAGALVLIGAFAVHELRYVVGGRHQDEHAHAYLPWALLVACAVLALVATEFAARLVLARRSGGTAPPPAGIRWLAVSTLLFAIFTSQEIAEQALTHGYVDLASSLAAEGGWTAFPLAFAVGAVIALLLRGAQALLTLAGRRRATPRRARPRAARGLPPRLRPRIPVIACHLAGRAPPSVVI